MTSELRVNNLKGSTTADVINVTTGSTTTKLQLGIASHALHFNHQTPAVIKSWNNSSVTDVAVGQYQPIMITSYSDANYIMTNSNNFDVNTEADAAGGQLHSLNTTGTEVAPATNTYTVRTDGDSSASKDLKYGYTTAHGDLA